MHFFNTIIFIILTHFIILNTYWNPFPSFSSICCIRILFLFSSTLATHPMLAVKKKVWDNGFFEFRTCGGGGGEDFFLNFEYKLPNNLYDKGFAVKHGHFIIKINILFII